jgi:hypothetical protein
MSHGKWGLSMCLSDQNPYVEPNYQGLAAP